MTIHTITATDQTVKVGVIDRSFPPILEVESGDELMLETWGLWGNAVNPSTTFAEIMQLRQTYAGKGPHSMTGPIAIKNAKPGMMLQVDILKLELGPYGFNLSTPAPNSRGLLSKQFPDGGLRHFVFNEDRTETELFPGFKLKLRPFLGILGVAPEAEGSHISSIPGNFGGNIDCLELIEGTTLFLPIWVDRAFFYAGDAHALQGSGEVNGTAIETSMECAHLKLSLWDKRRLSRPHAITPEHLITMGIDVDLRVAATQAIGDMVDWLVSEFNLSPGDAYVLCSLQADLIITQAVNGHNGVHARISRQLLKQCNVT